MTLVRSPFDVTFDVTSRYRVQRYEIISGDLDSAFDALAEEVRAGVASSGRMIPSYSAFDSLEASAHPWLGPLSSPLSGSVSSRYFKAGGIERVL